MSMNRTVRLVVCVTAGVTATVSLAADTTFTAVWKTPVAYEISLAGRKVAALVIANDLSLRMSGEEALSRELTARGFQGIATYRFVPGEEVSVVERARVWFERLGVEGVVALRPISAETTTTRTPDTWMSSSYSTLWGYYGYGWTTIYVPGASTRERVVAVETTIYSVPRNALLWAGVSQTRNPEQLGAFIQELAGACVQELHKVGLAKRLQK